MLGWQLPPEDYYYHRTLPESRHHYVTMDNLVTRYILTIIRNRCLYEPPPLPLLHSDTYLRRSV